MGVRQFALIRPLKILPCSVDEACSRLTPIMRELFDRFASDHVMMKSKISACFYLAVSFILTVFSGLVFLNNISVIIGWWVAFHRFGGDAAHIPYTGSGILPWLDWSAVDYSSVATLIPFVGFFLITLGLARALSGREQDAEVFPFFKGYDQLNIALGLIGTLWGIIIIGYFQIDSVTMGNLMMCLHTALFSTLIAVVWVFIVDHSMLRPLVLHVLRHLQGREYEDENVLEVLNKLTVSAGGLCDVWDGNRACLTALNDSVGQVRSELVAFAGISKNAAHTLSQDLTAAARTFISELTVASQGLSERHERAEAALLERQKQRDATQQAFVESIGSVAHLVSGIQKVQEQFAIAAERLAVENVSLTKDLDTEQNTSNALRGTVAELKGERAGHVNQINELIENMRATEASFTKRLEKLRDDYEQVRKDIAQMEGEKQRAQQDADDNLNRAKKAEKVLSKIKSTFTV